MTLKVMATPTPFPPRPLLAWHSQSPSYVSSHFCCLVFSQRQKLIIICRWWQLSSAAKITSLWMSCDPSYSAHESLSGLHSWTEHAYIQLHSESACINIHRSNTIYRDLLSDAWTLHTFIYIFFLAFPWFGDWHADIWSYIFSSFIHCLLDESDHLSIRIKKKKNKYFF